MKIHRKVVVQALSRGFGWLWNRKGRLAVLVVIFVVAAPKPLRSQFADPCCAMMSAGLTSISSSLTTTVGGGLNNIATIEKDIQKFEQTVVWSEKLINEAKALVGTVRGFYVQIQGLTRIPVNSATLAGPQQLEQILLSRNPALIAQTGAQYQAIYGGVPTPTDAPPNVRNLIDSTDATAQAALKRAIEIDALADLELQASEQIIASVQTAAPGSAPLIEAQADAWLVRANAYTQSATADLMRIRAISLANGSADVKMGAANAANMTQQLQNLLKRQ
jgi:hypothetical protein